MWTVGGVIEMDYLFFLLNSHDSLIRREPSEKGDLKGNGSLVLFAKKIKQLC